MKILSRYLVRSIPRFSKEEVDAQLYDIIAGQRALWNAMIFQIIQKYHVSAELRIECFGFDQDLQISLGIFGNDSSETLSYDLKQIEALLPTNYLWENNIPFAPSTDSPKRIARVIRKMEFIDIPSISPFSMRSGRNNAMISKEVGTNDIFSNLIIGLLSKKGEPLRELPLHHATLADLHGRRYCLALPGPVDQLTPRQRTLYQEFLRAGRAIISFCVHPIPEDQLAIARIHALNWKRFLDPFAPEIASSGFTDFSKLREAYNRFSLPSSYLVNVTIRVAATADEKAIGLANVVAAWLGGAKGFRVYPPTKDSAPDAVIRRDIDIASENWTEKRFVTSRSRVLKELIAQGVASVSDEDLLDFIALLPHVYTMQEAEDILRLPIAEEDGLPGIDSRLIAPFTTPSLKFLPVLNNDGGLNNHPSDYARIGMVCQPGADIASNNNNPAVRYEHYAWHTIAKSDLTKHALVVGSTGSGKTMTTLFIARELDRLKVPMMVIEPVKTEYYDRLKDKLSQSYRLRLEGTEEGKPAKDFLAFDPLRIQKGVTVARHASYLKSCFEAAFPMEPVVSLILENGLLEYYTTPSERGGCGLKKFSRGGSDICRIKGKDVYPSFATFRKYFVETFLPREFQETRNQSSAQRTQDFKEIFSRRFSNLADGLLGECFHQADEWTRKNPKEYYDVFSRYLNVNTIVELDAVPDADQKALLMAFILTYVFEKRQADDLESREKGKPLPNTLRHMMIIEEAHRVLASSAVRGGGRGDLVGQDSKAKAVGLFVDMLAEIRAFGQGLTIVEQIPTKIIPEAVKNTNLKIMLRLTSKDDRDYLGEAMNFTEAQKRFVTNLKIEKGTKINFVLFEEGVDQPLMLGLPLPNKSEASWLYDEFF